jgi:hypothetical protein
MVVAVVVLLVSAARDASAQVFISPFIGTTLSSPVPNGHASKMGYGVAFGVLGKIVGFDAEIAYFPEVVNNSAVNKSKVGRPRDQVLTGGRRRARDTSASPSRSPGESGR